MAKCCICGRELPNRFSVAGKCTEEGCEAVFCALHWHNGNKRCLSHGWKSGGILSKDDEVGKDDEVQAEREAPPVFESNSKESTKVSDNVKNEKSEATAADNGAAQKKNEGSKFSLEQGKKVLSSVIGFASKLGSGAVQYVQKLRYAKTPEGALDSIDEQLNENRVKREPIMARAEALYKEIVAKKKAYQSAPPARKKLLELELKSMMSEYKGLERQLTAFFENENTLNVVRGRLVELMALGLRKVNESDIDKLTDDIEDAFEESEGVSDALNDLDRAGARKERAADKEAFADALAGFEEYEPDGIDEAVGAEADSFDIEPPMSAAKDESSAPIAEEE